MIDAQLAAAGWAVQNRDQINLSAAHGVAVREMQSQGGPADYVLFVDGKALGVLEAKKAGTTLSGVAEQTKPFGNPCPPQHSPDNFELSKCPSSGTVPLHT